MFENNVAILDCLIKDARKKNMKLIGNVIAAFEKGDILQNVDSITERRYSLEMRHYLECYFDSVANLIDLFSWSTQTDNENTEQDILKMFYDQPSLIKIKQLLNNQA